MPDDADLHFAALSHGLTLEQYEDAVRIARLGGITRETRALALCMKYPLDTWVAVLRATVRILEG